ncbi:MAG TPA: peptidoglycan-binding domain-containing protein [Roseiflexaceae bacterium]
MTSTFQRAAGLTADGIVGPRTWSQRIAMTPGVAREGEAEVLDTLQQIKDLWGQLPDDIKNQIKAQVRQLWDVRGPLWLKVIQWVGFMVFRRGVPIQTAVRQAGAQFNLRPPRPRGRSPDDVRVRQYHRRQLQRGRVPGRNPQMRGRGLREFEHELEAAATGAALEQFLEGEEEALYEAIQGQERRDPAGQRALRFAAYLRRQGFLPSQHFVQRFLQRAQARGLRLDPRLFAQQFYQARHYRQTRPGYNTRIAVLRGIPIVYRMGDENTNRVVLVSLLPEGALPSVVPAAPPRPLAREAMASRRRGSAGGRPLQRRPTSSTLVVGRGRASRKSSLTIGGVPDTMDFSSATNPHFHTRLERALVNFPRLRRHYRDVVLERMGLNPNAQPGTLTTGLTPAGIQVARQLLRPGGTLRILQDGPSLADIERDIRGMLPPGHIHLNVRRRGGALLVTATY